MHPPFTLIVSAPFRSWITLVPQRLQNQQVILLPPAEIRLRFVSAVERKGGTWKALLVRSHLVFARNAGEFGEDGTDAEGGAGLETAFVAITHGIVVSIISISLIEGCVREEGVFDLTFT
jgi:hypothetical protein